MKRAAIFCIRVYQKTLSPDHGPLRVYFPDGYCRFHPTCSDYGIEAYRQHGFLKGTALAAWRVCRCNPWNAGGNDPVPPKRS